MTSSLPHIYSLPRNLAPRRLHPARATPASAAAAPAARAAPAPTTAPTTQKVVGRHVGRGRQLGPGQPPPQDGQQGGRLRGARRGRGHVSWPHNHGLPPQRRQQAGRGGGPAERRDSRGGFSGAVHLQRGAAAVAEINGDVDRGQPQAQGDAHACDGQPGIPGQSSQAGVGEGHGGPRERRARALVGR